MQSKIFAEYPKYFIETKLLGNLDILVGLLKLDAKLPQVYLYFNDNGSGMVFAALSSNAPKSGSGHARCPSYSRPGEPWMASSAPIQVKPANYMHYNTIEECNTCEKTRK